jgi:hypothetical protein
VGAAMSGPTSSHRDVPSHAPNPERKPPRYAPGRHPVTADRVRRRLPSVTYPGTTPRARLRPSGRDPAPMSHGTSAGRSRSSALRSSLAHAYPVCSGGVRVWAPTSLGRSSSSGKSKSASTAAAHRWLPFKTLLGPDSQ